MTVLNSVDRIAKLAFDSWHVRKWANALAGGVSLDRCVSREMALARSTCGSGLCQYFNTWNPFGNIPRITSLRRALLGAISVQAVH